MTLMINRWKFQAFDRWFCTVIRLNINIFIHCSPSTKPLSKPSEPCWWTNSIHLELDWSYLDWCLKRVVLKHKKRHWTWAPVKVFFVLTWERTENQIKSTSNVLCIYTCQTEFSRIVFATALRAIQVNIIAFQLPRCLRLTIIACVTKALKQLPPNSMTFKVRL